MQPDEVYNLGAQCHVAVSFEAPEYTADVDAHRHAAPARGDPLPRPGEEDPLLPGVAPPSSTAWCRRRRRSETTPFHPRCPYAVAKLYAYWITVNYREAYGMYACNGILFNHESPRRGETFVTRKITRGLANIAQGLEKCLFLGNIDALRDWGHAKDYVRMQWMMLQQDAARGLRHRHRRAVSPCASSSAWSAAELGHRRCASRARASTRTASSSAHRRRQGAGAEGRATCVVGSRSALLPPGRSRDAARRPDQGQEQARLGAGDHRAGDVRRDGGRRPEDAKQHALLRAHGHAVSVSREGGT